MSRPKKQDARNTGDKALRRVEEQYRQLFYKYPAPMWVYDTESKRFLEVNEAAMNAYGYSREEFLAMTIADIRPEEDHSRLIASYAKIANTTYQNMGIWRHRRKDGSLLDVEIISNSVVYDGRPARAVVANNVTDRLRAERERHELEERFRVMANSAPVMIWMAGTDARCEWFNHSWLVFTGRTLEQENGDGWTEGVHPADLTRCLRVYQTAFAARDTFQMEYRIRRRDGVYCWVMNTGVPRFQENGAFAGYIGSCVDITEKRRAEEENTRLLAETREVAQKQRALIKDVLFAVTEGKLRLCDSPADLPARLTPQVPDWFPVTPPSLRVLRRVVEAQSVSLSFNEERRFDLLTAVSEAAMNAIVHGSKGEALVCTDPARGIVQVWVRDRGSGMGIAQLHRAVLERGFTTAGTFGHGYWMMLKTADHIYLLTGPGGTTVVLEQARAFTEPAWMPPAQSASYAMDTLLSR